MDKNIDIRKLSFDYLDLVACFTGNNTTNKSMEAIRKPKIINALMQLEENIHEILRQLNAYDASSILIAESNWMKRNHFNKYMPPKGAPKKIKVGQVCTVDYGKTYKGEIGYIHPGLCIGKKNEKYLIIPMTTAKRWRESCYHPDNNPKATKEYRQALSTEGFSKDAVLLVSDTKFVSGGRILELHEVLSDEVIKDIQCQLFAITFPDMFKEYMSIMENNHKLQNKVDNLERQIKNLKLKLEKRELQKQKNENN